MNTADDSDLYLMSDADFNDASSAIYEQGAPLKSEPDEQNEPTETETEETDVEETEVTEDEIGSETEVETEDGADDGDADTETEEDEIGSKSNEEDSDTEEAESEQTGEEKPEEDLNQLLAPFKAGGKQVQARSVAEALQLQQLGAHYTQSMQKLKPHLRHIKTLEKNGLLDETKLNYLIDLSNKNPQAIAKLVKESGIDSVDLVDKAESVDDYVPNDNHVTEHHMQLDAVLSEIENTPTFQQCVDVIGNQWDKGSQEALYGNPAYIRELNLQMQDGTYNKIQAEVDRIQMYGGLANVSNFQAYQMVGRQMIERGDFAQKPTSSQTPVATTQVKPKDTTRSQKRKAANPSKASAKAAKAPVKDIWDMTDEEVRKITDINL